MQKVRMPDRTGRLLPASWKNLQEDEAKKTAKQIRSRRGIRAEGRLEAEFEHQKYCANVLISEQTIVLAQIYVYACLNFWRGLADCLLLSCLM